MSDKASGKKGALDWYFKSNLLMRILVGLALGAVVGLVVGPKIAWVKPFGDLFVRLLSMIVVPVIFLSLVGGAASISPARLGRVGVKIVIYYLFTTVVAIIIGLTAMVIQATQVIRVTQGTQATQEIPVIREIPETPETLVIQATQVTPAQDTSAVTEQLKLAKYVTKTLFSAVSWIQILKAEWLSAKRTVLHGTQRTALKKNPR